MRRHFRRRNPLRAVITAHRALALAILLGLSLASSLMAQTINQNIGGGIGFTFDGGISGKGSAAAPPLTPCGTGVLNLSTGCVVLPLLGGL